MVLVQVATRLLKHTHGQNEQCGSLMRALAAAGQAAMAVNPATAANIAEALVAAEAGAAGLLIMALSTSCKFSRPFDA